MMKELTKAEEQVMLLLWQKGKALVRDILNELPEPKPAYTTVSTIVRILEGKGFVAHEELGNTHLYYRLVNQDEYAGKFMRGFVKDYFSNSYKNLVSFFSRQEDISIRELEEIGRIINSEINKKRD